MIRRVFSRHCTQCPHIPIACRRYTLAANIQQYNTTSSTSRHAHRLLEFYNEDATKVHVQFWYSERPGVGKLTRAHFPIAWNRLWCGGALRAELINRKADYLYTIDFYYDVNLTDSFFSFIIQKVIAWHKVPFPYMFFFHISFTYVNCSDCTF